MLDKDQKKLAEELLFSKKGKPSFAKGLFFGRFDNDIVVPFPTPSREDKEASDRFLEKVKEFAETKIDPKQNDRESTLPKELIAGLGELGLLSLTIPKEYGGLGLSQYAYAKAMEVISARCGSTALFINAHQSVGLKALLLFGTDEQKSRWLPRLSKGKALAAFSLTEANAGSDAAGIETVATYDKEKKSYTIRGRKQWTTNGSIADILTVMAKGEDGKITAFLVTPDMPGFKVLDKALEKVGMRGSTTSNLLFDGVVVPEENVLGKVGAGLKVCLTVLDYGRTTFGATCSGLAKELAKRANEHAVNRYQFKRPLASFELVKQKLADINADAYAMESLTLMTAGLIDRGVEDIMLESAMLKVFNSETLWHSLYETMQIYGGRSFFTDQPLERMMRDARLNMIGEGSNEVLRAFIGAVGLRDVGMELKHLSDDFRKSPFNPALFAKAVSIPGRFFRKPSISIENQEFIDFADKIETLIQKLGAASLKAVIKYREGVLEKQLVLNRLAEASIAIYAMTAALLRLDLETKEAVAGPNDALLVSYFLEKSERKASFALKTLFDSEDAVINRLSDSISGVKT